MQKAGFVLITLMLMPIIASVFSANKKDMSKEKMTEGFSLDDGSLYCDGWYVTSVRSKKSRYWRHENSSFISVHDPDRISKDSVRLFFKGVSSWTWVDTEMHGLPGRGRKEADTTFKVLNEFLAQDEQNYYFLGVIPAGPLPDAPHRAFAFYFLKPISEGNSEEPIQLIESSDTYYSIGQTLFYRNRPLQVSVSDSFQVLSSSEFKKVNERFHINRAQFFQMNELLEIATDGKAIFFGSERSNMITVDQFNYLGGNYFSHGQKVYYMDRSNGREPYQELESADQASFEVLNGYYARDKHNVYCSGGSYRLKHADSSTLEVLSTNYVKDKSNVYYQSEKLPAADVTSFEVIGDRYGADNQNVFFQWTVIKGADPKSFKLLTPSTEETKYLLSRQINPNLSYVFGQDARALYFYTKKLSAKRVTVELLQELFPPQKRDPRVKY